MGYAGMSLNGIKTCGDYMFSGHTVCHSLLTLFVTEYTNKKCTVLHFFSRMIAVLGMILILAAHEHYTLDVICALYVSVKTFSSYHVLTTAKRVDRDMTKSWNPIFYFMEKPIETAKVENVFESPISAIKRWQKNIKLRLD
ncbi:Sphingomyelin synthase-related 1 [Thelohanellus kitauei]|uniref:Sphingomyelin synthase-related 1 n=1 Tax=Thelohanellus kitauei TaxID=669202 RepID=A0A0C2I8V7_THEKT|nr:Sphingomyelin synthase-related 1 [Thelohanellus kitauei]